MYLIVSHLDLLISLIYVNIYERVCKYVNKVMIPMNIHVESFLSVRSETEFM